MTSYEKLVFPTRKSNDYVRSPRPNTEGMTLREEQECLQRWHKVEAVKSFQAHRAYHD